MALKNVGVVVISTRLLAELFNRTRKNFRGTLEVPLALTAPIPAAVLSVKADVPSFFSINLIVRRL